MSLIPSKFYTIAICCMFFVGFANCARTIEPNQLIPVTENGSYSAHLEEKEITNKAVILELAHDSAKSADENACVYANKRAEVNEGNEQTGINPQKSNESPGKSKKQIKITTTLAGDPQSVVEGEQGVDKITDATVEQQKMNGVEGNQNHVLGTPAKDEKEDDSVTEKIETTKNTKKEKFSDKKRQKRGAKVKSDKQKKVSTKLGKGKNKKRSKGHKGKK